MWTQFWILAEFIPKERWIDGTRIERNPANLLHWPLGFVIWLLPHSPSTYSTADCMYNGTCYFRCSLLKFGVIGLNTRFPISTVPTKYGMEIERPTEIPQFSGWGNEKAPRSKRDSGSKNHITVKCMALRASLSENEFFRTCENDGFLNSVSKDRSLTQMKKNTTLILY